MNNEGDCMQVRKLRWHVSIAVLSFIALFHLLGCSSDEQKTETVVDCTQVATPANANALLAELTPEQKAQFCDHNACIFGGYGKQLTCPDGDPVQVPANREQCMGMNFLMPGCKATIADYERCSKALVLKPCAITLLLGDECSSVSTFECLTSLGYYQAPAMPAAN
jgi:hypothetical protein